MSENHTVENFLKRRFGIFLHWGVYAEIGGCYHGEEMPYIGEWAQMYYKIPNAEYENIARTFNPVQFNAREWVSLMAEAGAKYIVYTAKHHDGFAMYHSHCDPFNITDFTPFHRDPLKELADACAEHNMGLGIYYSQNLDWHHPHARTPDPERTRNVGDMHWGNDWDFPDKNKNFELFFRDKCIPQLKELLTEYGPVCELWFDCAIDMTKNESAELYSLVHSLQPDCAVNSRLGHGYQDFLSLGDNQNMHGKSPIPVESPITLNDTWGFKYHDNNWKSPRLIAERLAALADRNANLLLNIGPQPDGRFPEGAVNVLRTLAQWNSLHPDVIAGTEPNPFPEDFPWGPCTKKDNCLNFFLTEPRNMIVLPGVNGKIKSASVPFSEKPYLTLYPKQDDSSLLPVIQVEFESAPVIDSQRIVYDTLTELSPYSAKVTVLNQNQTQNTENISYVDPASVTQTIQNTMFIDCDGTAASWHNPNERLEWKIRITEPGTYEIELITTQAIYDAPWQGNRTVEVVWQADDNTENIILTALIEKTEDLYSPCYASAKSHLGVLTLSQGNGVLSCRTVQVKMERETLGMHLSKILLRKK